MLGRRVQRRWLYQEGCASKPSTPSNHPDSSRGCCLPSFSKGERRASFHRTWRDVSSTLAASRTPLQVWFLSTQREFEAPRSMTKWTNTPSASQISKPVSNTGIAQAGVEVNAREGITRAFLHRLSPKAPALSHVT